MSNLQPNCCLKFDFQKVDQHAGGKWLIHDTKPRQDNQLQSRKLYKETKSVIAAAQWKMKSTSLFIALSINTKGTPFFFNMTHTHPEFHGLSDENKFIFPLENTDQ